MSVKLDSKTSSPSLRGSRKNLEVMNATTTPSLEVSKLEPQGDHQKAKENFFDMPNEETTNIWSSDFIHTLRKGSLTIVAAPFVEDTSVERVGGAYIDVERILTLSRRAQPQSSGMGVGADTGGVCQNDGAPKTCNISPFISSPSFSSRESHKYSPRSPVRRPGDEYDRVKKLEGQIENLEKARWLPPTIPEIINRILLGLSYSLSWFKSMEEKMALLDSAIATNDGNCIMAIVLFIRRSVDQSIFLNVMDRRPVAAQHYMSFLKQLKNWKELKALYRRLNRQETLGECDAPGLSIVDRLRMIKGCPMEFKKITRLQHPEDVQYVEEYSRLVNAQYKIEEADGHGGAKTLHEEAILFKPLTTTLLHCCKYRGQEKRTGNPEELRKLFNIPENQYFQMDLLSLALQRDWKAIEHLFTSKGLLGISKKKKSPIGFERVVRLLAQDRYRAPDQVLATYLKEVEDLEERYLLAMEVRLYMAALDCLVALRDRDRVQSFISSVPPQKHYEIRAKVDQILANTQIKWKY